MKGRETGVNKIKMHCTKSQRTNKRMRKNRIVTQRSGVSDYFKGKLHLQHRAYLPAVHFPWGAGSFIPGSLSDPVPTIHPHQHNCRKLQVTSFCSRDVWCGWQIPRGEETKCGAHLRAFPAPRNLGLEVQVLWLPSSTLSERGLLCFVLFFLNLS